MKEYTTVHIMNPTGNITALAEGLEDLSASRQAADEIMRLHPEVEQVGFVYFSESPDNQPAAELAMAGGEFCGNASMCAAVLSSLRRNQTESAGAEDTVILRVSGSVCPVSVRLRKENASSFRASVEMPPALRILEEEFTWNGITALLPLVEFEGISDLIIEKDSPFYGLLKDREAAEAAVRSWCGKLRAAGLGIMFLDEKRDEIPLIPLVFIPGSGTLFWENSCASGSCAAGAYLASREDRPLDLSFTEPGGTLRVFAEPSGKTILSGTVLICSRSLPAAVIINE